MRGAPVQSFGRRNETPDPDPVVLLPPVQMPPVQLPVVLVVDAAALQHAAAQITQMVTEAVRAGFEQALADQDAEASGEPACRDVQPFGCDGAGLDPHAGVGSVHAAGL